MKSGANAIQSAPAEVKTAWDTAMAAMKTNGYAVAIMELQAAQSHPNITPKQAEALQNAASQINDQMYAAANKDDPAGKAAVEELRKAMRR
jgi:hypothetical protein